MKNNSARIKDIAEKAGVSVGTVDRVLHNRGKVAPEVENRILQIISELNYEPNLIARALGSNKKYRIAALLPDPAFDPYWQAPKDGVEAAQAGLKQYGVQIHQYLFNPYDVNSYIEKASQVAQIHPQGIFLSPIFYRETMPFFEKWQELHIPYVLFNTHIAEANALSYVGQDSYQSGLLAGKLIHFGQPDPSPILVAHIDEDISNAAHLLRKEQGFRDYFKENAPNAGYHIAVVSLNRSNPEEFNSKLKQAFEQHPNLNSIYSTTSRAYDIVAWLEKNDIKNVKIVGYDLLSQNLEHLNTNQISFLINQNPGGQGYWGIHQLADHLVFKKQVASLKYLPLDVVTKENVSYYTRRELNGSPVL